MTPREQALRRIRDGDLFNVDGDHGHPITCLATLITETTIFARSITHQVNFEFSRETGIGKGEKYVLGGTIQSVAQLPADIHDTLIGLDRRYRSPDPGPLSKAEKVALSFIDDFYDAHPIDK